MKSKSVLRGFATVWAVQLKGLNWKSKYFLLNSTEREIIIEREKNWSRARIRETNLNFFNFLIYRSQQKLWWENEGELVSPHKKRKKNIKNLQLPAITEISLYVELSRDGSKCVCLCIRNSIEMVICKVFFIHFSVVYFPFWFKLWLNVKPHKCEGEFSLVFFQAKRSKSKRPQNNSNKTWYFCFFSAIPPDCNHVRWLGWNGCQMNYRSTEGMKLCWN